MQQRGDDATHLFRSDVQQRGHAVEQFLLCFGVLFLHFHRHTDGIAGANVHLAANVQLSVELFAQLVAQEEGETRSMIKAIHQRLAEERIVQVADFFVGNARAGVIDMKYQAILVFRFMIDHQ
ncbi:hypothetical protein D3C80_1583900 [compost metagenome]